MIHRRRTNEIGKKTFKGVELYEGTSLIEQLRNMKQNGEKPEIVHEMIYTEKKQGVIKSYNIRADRFAIGQENAEKISKYKNSKEMQTGTATNESKKETESIKVEQGSETENH